MRGRRLAAVRRQQRRRGDNDRRTQTGAAPDATEGRGSRAFVSGWRRARGTRSWAQEGLAGAWTLCTARGEPRAVHGFLAARRWAVSPVRARGRARRERARRTIRRDQSPLYDQ